jgi:hypothetical protein
MINRGKLNDSAKLKIINFLCEFLLNVPLARQQSISLIKLADDTRLLF